MTKPSKFAGALAKLGQATEKPENLNSGQAEAGENQQALSPIPAVDTKTGKPENGKTRKPGRRSSGVKEPLTVSQFQKPEVLNSGITENTNKRKKEKSNTESTEIMNSRNQEIMQSGSQDAGEREKYSTLIDRELVQELRMYAVRHRMKDWQVLDAALRAFLQRQV